MFHKFMRDKVTSCSTVYKYSCRVVIVGTIHDELGHMFAVRLLTQAVRMSGSVSWVHRLVGFMVGSWMSMSVVVIVGPWVVWSMVSLVAFSMFMLVGFFWVGFPWGCFTGVSWWVFFGQW